MKNLVIVFVCLGLAGTATAQSKSAEAFRAKYQDDRDAKVVSMNGSMFKLFSNIAENMEENDESAAIGRIAEGIQSMQILSVPVFKSGLQPAEIDQLHKDLLSEKYEELMRVRDGDQNIYFMAQGDENELRNMLVLVREDEEFIMFNIDGVLNMKDLAYLVDQHKD
jgi:transcriptional regulatory protein LevR